MASGIRRRRRRRRRRRTRRRRRRRGWRRRQRRRRRRWWRTLRAVASMCATRAVHRASVVGGGAAVPGKLAVPNDALDRDPVVVGVRAPVGDTGANEMLGVLAGQGAGAARDGWERGVLRGRWLGVRRGDVRVAYLKVQASWQQSAPPPEGKGTSPLLSVQMKSAERCGMQCVMLCTGAVAGLGFDGLMRPKSCSRFGSLKF